MPDVSSSSQYAEFGSSGKGAELGTKQKLRICHLGSVVFKMFTTPQQDVSCGTGSVLRKLFTKDTLTFPVLKKKKISLYFLCGYITHIGLMIQDILLKSICSLLKVSVSRGSFDL